MIVEGGICDPLRGLQGQNALVLRIWIVRRGGGQDNHDDERGGANETQDDAGNCHAFALLTSGLDLLARDESED